MATINDVASLAQVSKKTVSRVINNVPSVRQDIRARVDRAIADLNFKPNAQARSLAFGRSFLIGLLYDNPSSAYIVNLLEGVLDVLRDRGMELVIHPCRHQSGELLGNVGNFIDGQRLAGVILPPPLSENEDLIALLRERDCRYVRIASMPLESAAAMVVTNDQVGAEEAARHLAELGHRRIALVRGPRSFRSSAVRGTAFIEALATHGLALDPACDIEGAYTVGSGVAAGHQLLSLPVPPTAVFALNDDMAVGVMQAARQRRLELPRDLSVVGFDDLPVAALAWPSLTTVRLPIREMGQLAARRLIAGGQGDASPADEPRVTPELIVRQSSVACERTGKAARCLNAAPGC